MAARDAFDAKAVNAYVGHQRLRLRSDRRYAIGVDGDPTLHDALAFARSEKSRRTRYRCEFFRVINGAECNHRLPPFTDRKYDFLR